MTDQKPIAVTGAAGGVGGRVAARLADAGILQRLVVRDASRAPKLPGTEVRQAEYADGDAMKHALSGAGALFLVSGREVQDRLEQHKTAVDAAVAAGIGRIVYLSFLAAAPQATFTLARQHFNTEEHIRAKDLPFTFLRDSLYLEVPSHMPFPDGVIRGPAGNGRVAWVARDDVADVAVAVLTGAGHDEKTYDVTGPEALTMAETVERMSKVIGTEISYQNQTMEEARASRSVYGAPDWEVEGWITSYAAIATGEMDVVSDTQKTLTGHHPQTLEEFLERNPASYEHLVPS